MYYLAHEVGDTATCIVTGVTCEIVEVETRWTRHGIVEIVQDILNVCVRLCDESLALLGSHDVKNPNIRGGGRSNPPKGG